MGFLDFLDNFLAGASSAGSALASAFVFLVTYINLLFLALLKFIIGVGNFFYAILKNVGKFFKTIWTTFFKGIFNKVFNALLKAHDWLESHLAPVVRFLQKVRAIFDRVFNTYVKPILNIIQQVRKVLLVLRLLHVKWAQALDAKLLQIEVKIASVFIQTRAVLNNVIDAVNIVVDPTRILRHPTLVISIRRSLPAIVTAVTGKPISFFFPGADTNGLTSPAAVSPGIAWDFTSTQDVPDDGDIVDLPPLDYFVDTFTSDGDSEQTLLALNSVLLQTSGAPSPAIVDVGIEAEEVAASFKELLLAAA